MVLADKQTRLERIADHFRDGGIAVDTKVLLGKSSEAITREVIAWDASMVVRYLKGVRSKFPGLFGNTARTLMRYCPVPLLFVGNEAIAEPRVLACFDTQHEEAENSSIFAEAARLAENKTNLLALSCWALYGQGMMQEHMEPVIFQESVESAERLHQKAFEQFLDSHDFTKFGDVRLEKGDPVQVIPSFCNQQNIDVAVMCSATLNHPLLRYFGSTIESVIERLPCSLLVVKPKGFVSPLAERAETAPA
jgi:universal stress protein E